MITLHTCSAKPAASAADLSAAALPADVVWIDLLDPDAAETAFVERAAGVHVPSREELSEVEISSRLRHEHDALYLSASVVIRSATGEWLATPLGFVLTRDRLITVRFEELDVIASFAGRIAKPGAAPPGSAGAFIGLMEEVVDRIADQLEHVGSELGAVSHRVFRADTRRTAQPRRPARERIDLQVIMRRVGSNGDLTSDIRDSLLTIGRIVPYVAKLAAEWLPPQAKPRLETLQQDIISLNDYESHLANKVQLLLDATLGLINIEQNNIIKVLTVVSVVGVPPTLVASMYGMNFRHMPELDWAWGYPYGLALIALSAIVPLLWFKLRGWL